MKLTRLLIILQVCICIALAAKQQLTKPTLSQDAALKLGEKLSENLIKEIFRERNPVTHYDLKNDSKNNAQRISEKRYEESKAWEIDTIGVMVTMMADGTPALYIAGNPLYPNKRMNPKAYGLKDKDLNSISTVVTQFKNLHPLFRNSRVTAVEIKNPLKIQDPKDGRPIRIEHAETKLLAYMDARKALGSFEEQVLAVAASKPACKKCHPELKKRNIHANGENNREPTHWRAPDAT